VKFIMGHYSVDRRHCKPSLTAKLIIRVLVPAGRANNVFRAIPFLLISTPKTLPQFHRSGVITMTKFYAQPYSTEHTGFYFDSIETFEAGMDLLNKKGCEEVEIQFIDGDYYLVQLAKSASIGQGDVQFWYEELEDLDCQDVTRICFLLSLGMSTDDALNRYDYVCLHYGTAEDYAHDMINETTEIPENLSFYIDYEAIARDMKLNGEIIEIECDLIVTNAHEF